MKPFSDMFFSVKIVDVRCFVSELLWLALRHLLTRKSLVQI